MTGTFTCAACGGTFPKAWSEAEAEAEAVAVWGVEDAMTADGMAIVCDDCYRELLEPADLAESTELFDGVLYPGFGSILPSTEG